MDAHTLHPIAILPVTLKSKGFQPRKDGSMPTYRQTYTAATSGKFPTTYTRGRWMWREQDLPAIAAALGLSA